MPRRLRRLAALLGASTLLAAVAAAIASARRARGVPLSPLTAGWRVGADYVERAGVAGPGDPVGEMDDMGRYARPGFDPGAVDPEVRRFYERTREYEMRYAVHWHRPFRAGAALATRLTARLEQLALPGPGEGVAAPLRSRLVDVDPAADPRDGARAWIRTREDGRAVFVAVYAAHERDGETYTSIAVPLPGSNLSTVLEPRHLDAPGGAGGVELTTRASGDPGLYLAVPPLAFALPMDQRFRVWPADADGAPDPPDGSGADLVAVHDMWLFGRRFLTVTYGIRRAYTSTSTS
ncbi:MAG: hypothetical protein ABEJ04_06285 [Halobacteriaceae archaeon]